MIERLNLGCGKDILPGYVNVDYFPLPGVDIVCDLTQFPWPLQSNTYTEIVMLNVLEHVPDTLRTLREIWRIARPGAKVTIRVPYWNGYDAFTDPTHLKFFSERTLMFFDHRSTWYRAYEHMFQCKFVIERLGYYIRIPVTAVKGKYLLIHNPLIKMLLSFLATYLNNIICVLEVDYRAIK